MDPKLSANRGNAGKGRPKGVPNKINALLRDEILQAAEAAHPEGRVAYLTQQARDNPNAFLTLLGKVLPTQMQHGQDPDNPLPDAIVLNIVKSGPA